MGNCSTTIPKIQKHPCFNGEAHNKYGRLHLPVSPICNVQCKFCKRAFNKCEERPGVSRAILTPDEAFELVERAISLCPELTVIGIAGPGDTLATDHALNTFKKIHQKFPYLINCLSTNGLLLSEKAEEIVSVGVETITVTVNAVQPEIISQIYSHIVYNNTFMTGEEAAEILITNQLDGIKKVVEYGAMVKVNTVLIPGVNDHHIEDIASVVSAAGASIMNIIPLIPQHEMQHIPAPNCTQVSEARQVVEPYLSAFKHCKHCRADAFGVPGTGKDLSRILYEDSNLKLEAVETFSHG